MPSEPSRFDKIELMVIADTEIKRTVGVMLSGLMENLRPLVTGEGLHLNQSRCVAYSLLIDLACALDPTGDYDKEEEEPDDL